MRIFSVLVLILCLTSCDYFDKKKVSAEDILNEELKSFNWNEVDEFPSFTLCDSFSTKLERRQCFETTLTKSISDYLGASTFVVSQSVNDTVVMMFQISETGQLTVLDIHISDEIKAQIPELDSLLKQSVYDLPTIHPALKRGQQVKTEFKMPIQIQTN